MIDTNNIPFLFSVGTAMSYRIAKEYYRNVQYVWCAPCFDSNSQPPTSNPMTIAKRYIEQIKSGDRHAREIESNIVGIMVGAKLKKEQGVITEEENKEICSIVGMAKYEDFFPVLYIIDTRKVMDKCQEIEVNKKASDTSKEFLITDLLVQEYELINLKKMLEGTITLSDKRVGL